MEKNINYVCSKCHRLMSDENFYTYKNGNKVQMCKKCLTMHVDPYDPTTFLWLLQKMDVPYIPVQWNVLRDRAFERDPKAATGTAIFGKYLSKMKLKQWRDYGYADSKEAVLVSGGTPQPLPKTLKQQLEQGTITHSQYLTLADPQALHEQYMNKVNTEQQVIGQNNAYNQNNFLSQQKMIDLAKDLTQDDQRYLAMKWGRLYKPQEWVQLQSKYNQMMSSFDIQDSDTRGNLILICKTYLKLNQALDQGDIQGYQKLSRAYDSLRKSSKFTAVQNKQKNDGFMNSLGQMVAYCEKVGGQIPKYDVEIDYDVLDRVIKDQKAYLRSLVYEDSALGRQIDDYIKKREAADVAREQKAAAAKQFLDETDEILKAAMGKSVEESEENKENEEEEDDDS